MKKIFGRIAVFITAVLLAFAVAGCGGGLYQRTYSYGAFGRAKRHLSVVVGLHAYHRQRRAPKRTYPQTDGAVRNGGHAISRQRQRLFARQYRLPPRAHARRFATVARGHKHLPRGVKTSKKQARNAPKRGRFFARLTHFPMCSILYIRCRKEGSKT